MRMNGELEAELLEAKIGVVELAEAEAKAHEAATRTTLELHAKKSALRLAVVEEAASHEADLAARQEETAAAVDETRARAEEWQRTAAAAEAEKDMADREDVRAHAQVEKPATSRAHEPCLLSTCHACPRVTGGEIRWHVEDAEQGLQQAVAAQAPVDARDNDELARTTEVRLVVEGTLRE